MDSRKLKITNATCKYGNLNIRTCGLEFFPTDVFGSSSRSQQPGVPITIEAKGINNPIKTDIPTDKKTGRPRWIFRERAWVKKFIILNNLAPGSIVTISRLAKRKYRISSNNNHLPSTKKPALKERDNITTKSVLKKPKIHFHCIKTTPSNNKPKEFLDVTYDQTCDCKGNNINCLTAKDWLKCQLGVWQFTYEGRDIRDKKMHPATFPIALARKVIDLFTHQGELVLDPFVGSGTTLVAAQDANRNAAGFDLQQKYVELSQVRLNKNSNMFNDTKQLAVCDDALNIPKYFPQESITLILTSPPYANLLNRKRKNKSRRNRKNEQLGKIEQYSQDPRDLGTMDIEKYTKIMGNIFENLLPLLRPKSHCVINVPDMWWKNKRITIHVSLIEELRKRGYELRNIIIWDRTNLVNQIGIFGWPSNYITMGVTFEYLLDFWKPPE